MKYAAGIVFCIAFAAGTAWADIVEIRGKGMMTGTIVSQDEKELAFRDNEGRVVRYAKSDVLFLDRDGSGTAQSKGASSGYLDQAKRFFAGMRYWPEQLRRWTDDATKKFRDVAGKPINREGANAKGDELARSMDEAARVQAQLVKNNRKVAAEIKRQRDEAEGVQESDAFSGTFGKL